MKHRLQGSAMSALFSSSSAPRAQAHPSLGRSALLATVLALCTWSTGALADTQVRTTTFEYDASGLPTKSISEPTTPNSCLQASFVYDTFGNQSSASKSACPGASGDAISSAAVARTSTTTFSADGRFALSASNPLAQSETRSFDPASGNLLSLTGPNGLTTSWLYDSFNRKTKETRADGTTTVWTYQLCSASGAACPGPIGGATPISVVSEQGFGVNAVASGVQSRTYYDALGRVLRSQTQGFDGAGAGPTLVQDTEYNARGQVARKSDSYVLGGTPVWSSYTYDALGRPIQESVPDPDASGGVATTSTSYNGLSFTLTNSKGQVKTTTKDRMGLIKQVVDNQGASITYGFDALGQLVQTNAAGSITTMSYNQRGQKIAMQDPAMGAWDYRYNVFGELVAQTDSLGRTVTLSYDALGRMTQRSEPDLVSQWSYDKRFDGSACGKGIGKLCEAKADNGYVRKHTYDTLGRSITTSTVLDSATTPALVSEAFDANTGRVISKTWPSGYQASYQYTPTGYLKKVIGGGTNGYISSVSYEVLAMNARGQITQYRLGNQITTVKTFNATNGRLSSLQSTKDGQAAGNVQNQSYTYDSINNLLSRGDANLALQESFVYDNLNRLSLATIVGGAVSPPTTTQVMYDARGNILYKSDVGRYWYDAARPNRMTNVTLETAPGAQVSLTGTRTLSYAFDDLKPGARSVNGVQVGNGNLEYTVSHDTVQNIHTVRGEAYTSFNMPATIQYGNFVTNTTSTADRTLGFVYGPEHQRIKQQVTLTGSGTSSYFAGATWYLNGEDSLGLSYEKEVRANGTIEEKHYVGAPGQTFAIFTKRSGTLNGLSATSTSYLHQDHLGSVSVITDASGAVVERMAYDPWGKRRKIDGNPDRLDALVGQKTDRGYTMHEHLDEVGVIHMNGRIYDPLLGRFMSADPYVQAPTNLKTFNRYSYVWNNPLKYYDPEGFMTDVLGGGVVSCPSSSDGSVNNCTSSGSGTGITWDSFKSFFGFGTAGDNSAPGPSVAPSKVTYTTPESDTTLPTYNGTYKRDPCAGMVGSCVVLTGAGASGFLGSTAAALGRTALRGAGRVVVVAAVAACAASTVCLVGAAAVAVGALAVNSSNDQKPDGADNADETKPPLSDYKDALGEVHDKVGKLPKGEDGKFGSPQAGDSKKGYRLDPPHDGKAEGDAESKYHFNWWDYTGGKKGRGGRGGAIPIGD